MTVQILCNMIESKAMWMESKFSVLKLLWFWQDIEKY